MSIFSKVPSAKPKRSRFNQSHEVKLTGKFGTLYPFMCKMCYPGDQWRNQSQILIRTFPFSAPIMHRVDAYVHYFAVPLRLLMDDFETFITGGDNGQQAIKAPKYFFSGSGSAMASVGFDKFLDNGSLLDYLGFPTYQKTSEITTNLGYHVSRFPISAYNLIYNEYYRDENLISPVDIHKSSGDYLIRNNGSTQDNQALQRVFALKKRAFGKDYFTSALSEPQKGPNVSLPLIDGTTVPVNFSFKGGDNIIGANGPVSNSGNLTGNNTNVTLASQNVSINNSHNLNVDLSQASAVTINNFRTLARMQMWFERQARGGTRYIEQIFSHFGIKSKDARLQRPEFIGGGRMPLVVSEVLQQSQTTTGDNASPLGMQAGKGISVGSNFTFKYFCEEHCVIMGIISIMPKAGYYQGMPREWDFSDKFEMMWPEFANLGEQPVKNGELYYQPDGRLVPSIVDSVNEGTFGYQSRYSELKYTPDSVHGDFRGNLKFWHLARDFGALPTLSQEFIEPNLPDLNRVFAVTDEDNDPFYIQIYNNLISSRLLPKYGVPKL